METATQRILIADDHPLFRDALKQALSGMLARVAIVEAGTLGEMTMQLESDDEVDLVLLDLAMPGARGFPASPSENAISAVPVVVSPPTGSRGDPPLPGVRRLGLHPEVARRDSIVPRSRTVWRAGLWAPPISISMGGGQRFGGAGGTAGDADAPALRVLTLLIDGSSTTASPTARRLEHGEGPSLGDSPEARRGERTQAVSVANRPS
jgi:hypothetical protein